MSRPRFLADNDLRDAIVSGLLLREPSAEFVRCRDVGIDAEPDDAVLAYAAHRGLIVVSHDVNTMGAAAITRINVGLPMAGVLLTAQPRPTRQVIDDLLMVWGASGAEEWEGAVDHLPL